MSAISSVELQERLRQIRLLIMDCDGVLTDGRLFFGPTGEELKVFFVRDGEGLVLLNKAGIRAGVITGRNSPIVEMRMCEKVRLKSSASNAASTPRPLTSRM